MSNITVNFAHANGFPVAAYKQFMSHLPDEIRVIAKAQYGHEPHFPISNNWENQITEMINFIESHASEPVYGVGHSFGALLTLVTCCARPDLFKGVLLMEPPAFTGWLSFALKWSKRMGLSDKLTPSGKARTRKAKWSKHDDMVQYFRSKTLFEDFSDESIQDYVESATQIQDDTRELTFKAHVEAEIFKHCPHNLKSLRGQLRVPATLVTATKKPVLNNAQVKTLLDYFPAKHVVNRGAGHLFPLEQPIASAKLVVSLLDELIQRAGE
ncbi:alpha/beta fold hydrolase [Alteromonas sp. a30]|uniref:alpha/beta fold hydrolase n=1 Tax=Alteromonas sp. a30 TaxID=2730917 RepID=UPI00228121CA|nr:alpha/beta hydrolase [Alteromonas sp. a30]MCY7296345.1 alpha/beta hydrolase [Alteromonas sp. a30]